MTSQSKALIQRIFREADIEVNGDRPWDIQVHNDDLYQRLIRESSLGLGESYMDEWWNVQQLDEFFAKLLKTRPYEGKFSLASGYLFELVRAKFTNLQSLSRSFQVGKHHYDLGNDLYKLMLDRRLNYSCAYWKNTDDFQAAQDAKLELICRKIRLQPGQTVLDIGCGWGAFMGYAAEKYGANCVGLTVSQEQKALGEKLYADLPVKFLLQDYRTFRGEFDRIVSIGMFEHVGYKNYPAFMEMAKACLKEDGLFLLHTIGSNTPNYGEMWLNKYIFPNGMLPSSAQICAAAEHLFVMEDWHNFGQDYDRTFMAYFANFDRHWSELEPKYGERFYRMWKYFLLSYAGAFRARFLQLWQIVYSKNGVPGGYQSVR